MRGARYVVRACGRYACEYLSTYLQSAARPRPSSDLVQCPIESVAATQPQRAIVTSYVY